MKTIKIKNLLEPLNYKGLRAVRSWCTDHDVLIFKQSKNEFVIESEFESVFEKPFVDGLKRKFVGVCKITLHNFYLTICCICNFSELFSYKNKKKI